MLSALLLHSLFWASLDFWAFLLLPVCYSDCLRSEELSDSWCSPKIHALEMFLFSVSKRFVFRFSENYYLVFLLSLKKRIQFKPIYFPCTYFKVIVSKFLVLDALTERIVKQTILILVTLKELLPITTCYKAVHRLPSDPCFNKIIWLKNNQNTHGFGHFPSTLFFCLCGVYLKSKVNKKAGEHNYLSQR